MRPITHRDGGEPEGVDEGDRPWPPGDPDLASGEIFLYAIWGVIAIGSMIVTAMVLRGGR